MLLVRNNTDGRVDWSGHRCEGGMEISGYGGPMSVAGVPAGAFAFTMAICAADRGE